MTKSIYIHIPFCKDICSYCDFCKIHYDKKYIDNYLDSLEKEILSRYTGEEVDTIYIGGGTPNSLTCDELEKLFKIVSNIKTSRNLEYSIEVNVECLDEEKIILFSKYNINRVSLGVQTFNSNLLKELNRYHDKNMVRSCVNLLKKHGISNISMDLIYGINEDISIVKSDIDYFLELDIPHISCYSLIIEDGTTFGILNKKQVDEEIDYKMYTYIRDKLNLSGYNQYEISNYSKKGYESIHNMNYWQNGEYYGFGIGAVSYINNYRITNTKNLTKYLNGVYEYERVFEDLDTQMENTMILGLRMIKGVSVKDFYQKYHKDIREVFDIEELLNTKKLILDGDYLRISEKYLYVSNDILIYFIKEEENV